MDELEQQLKRDAAEIDAGDTAQLRTRINASLNQTAQIRPVPESRSRGINLWWASSITGLATAAAVIVLINWSQPGIDAEPDVLIVNETVPDFVENFQDFDMPKIKAAEFAGPLEDELIKLQADIEKARKNLREDIDFTL
jgi:hypothetical protein